MRLWGVVLMNNPNLERNRALHGRMQGADHGVARKKTKAHVGNSQINSCCHISRGASDSMAGSWSMGSVAGLRKHSREGEYSSSTTLNSFCSVTIFSCTAGEASVGSVKNKA